MALAHRAKVKDPAKAFISTWRTSIVYTNSTANNQIKLPLESAGTYKFTIQWGDGTSNLITTWNQAETLHTYPAPGDYTVTITGFIKGWDWGAGAGGSVPVTGDMRKILTITQWGCLRFVNKLDPSPLPVLVWGAFYGCTNLILTGVTDMPNFKGNVSTQGFLRGCSAVTTVNNLEKWDVSKIQVFRSMLREMPLFNQNVGNWNMANATNLVALFLASTNSTTMGVFNNGSSDSIKNWNTSNVVTMDSIFRNQTKFNREVGLWDVSKVTVMSAMFAVAGASSTTIGIFNNAGSPSINNWNTSNVTTMASQFYGQQFFNQPLGNWNTSNVNSMTTMFYGPNINGFPGSFNQNISNWDTSKVTNMSYMFFHQRFFNQNIGNWDVSKVTNFTQMFNTIGTSGQFNNGNSNTINNWNTSLAGNMSYMFRNQPGFNQPIGNWIVSLVTDFTSFMQFKTFNDYTTANYDALLIGWASRPVKPNISINFGTIKYTAAATAARTILTSAPNNWTIVDGGI